MSRDQKYQNRQQVFWKRTAQELHMQPTLHGRLHLGPVTQFEAQKEAHFVFFKNDLNFSTLDSFQTSAVP